MAVLILNGGSSSWKIAAYDRVAADAVPVGPPLADVSLPWPPASRASGDVRDAIATACEKLRSAGVDLRGLDAVGHRIVHGGPRFTESVRIDAAVEAGLRELAPLAPNHNALETSGIDATRELFPNVPQVAAFDTAFHRTLPPAAFTYPGPYAWRERGVRRYGFHGLSVAYCVERTAQLLGEPHDLRLVVAHLGGGCSVTAVRDGASVDTTMGFTPLDGIMMSTRSGAVDPGILLYVARDLAANGKSGAEIAAELDDTLEHRSGLLGISGRSGDMREIESSSLAGDERAELALEMFVHRTAAAVSGMLTSLGRLDALAFAGGIGAHSATVRARTCAKLRFLGIDVDARANAAVAGAARIDASGPPVFALETHEEWYVARECSRVLLRTARAGGG
ncbi:MAG: acetate/propionate family kinase [Candidatus Eremiobacteraeota bacterium]|nr:acetate/propionate family kinase [Candidatus Eremiobacteraeota bacterium]